ncbi:hypothetical protein AN926_04930 [Thermus scotoductus]|uniref:Uncharacterized protein n=1 Tax=Thermus scotoductus TaxID=37636 RepID=A0A0N0ZPQ4_THESC|nr:hypothetical protein AN926_04930 [Thermus scotoductus]
MVLATGVGAAGDLDADGPDHWVLDQGKARQVGFQRLGQAREWVMARLQVSAPGQRVMSRRVWAWGWASRLGGGPHRAAQGLLGYIAKEEVLADGAPNFPGVDLGDLR